VNNKISIAPMVDRTDRNFRNFVRMINKDVLLYTEMITAQAILNGDLDYILGFDEVEHPIVLQIAATNPEEAYRAVKIAEKYNYDEINLNVGCPSDRVSGNMMGAYLMAFPKEVANIVKAMKEAVELDGVWRCTPSTGSTKVRYMGEKRKIQFEANSLIFRDLVMVLEKVLSCGAEGR